MFLINMPNFLINMTLIYRGLLFNMFFLSKSTCYFVLLLTSFTSIVSSSLLSKSNKEEEEVGRKIKKLINHISSTIHTLQPCMDNPYYDYLPNSLDDPYYKSITFYNFALDLCNKSVFKGVSDEHQKSDVTISFENMEDPYGSALNLLLESISSGHDTYNHLLERSMLPLTSELEITLGDGAYLNESVCLAAFLYTILPYSEDEDALFNMMHLNIAASKLNDMNASFFLYKDSLQKEKPYIALKYLFLAAEQGHPNAIKILKSYNYFGYPDAIISATTTTTKPKSSPVGVNDNLSDIGEQEKEQEKEKEFVVPYSEPNIVEYIASFFF